jgi:hypothetical protein
LATLTEDEVIPVWSLNALWGIFELPLPPPPPLVVLVVVDELVELHATAPSATRTTIPIAAVRVFHEAECNVPP